MIHVACGANGAYMPYVATMLHSLLTQDHQQRVCVHFMHDNALPETDRNALAGMVRELGGEWCPHLIMAERLEGFPATRRHSYEIWYRILLPELLPELPRVLYLDADTLVLQSLSALWATDLGDCIVGAIHNPLYPWSSTRFLNTLSLKSAADYFNSGVLLMNLDQWREEHVTDQLRAFVTAHPEAMLWPDQNALNAVLRDRWLRLSATWDAQDVYFHLASARLPTVSEDVRKIRSDPAVVHFIWPFKPLEYLCKHPYRGHFFRHLRQTPWRDAPMSGETTKTRLLRLLPQPFMWKFFLVALPLLRQRLRRAIGRSG